MARVIVTVKRSTEARVRDLEVPADLETTQLAELIVNALQWQSDAAGQAVRYEIKAEPLGRVLRPNESLAEAGVWDGSWLVFQPVGCRIQGPAGPPPPSPKAGPLGSWRPLGIDVPDTASDEQPPSDDAKPESRFVWKQLD